MKFLVYPYIPLLSLAMLAVSVPLWRNPRVDRGRIRATWVFITLWLVAWLSAALAHWLGQDTLVFHQIGRAFVELAVLNLGTILIFDYGLAKIRLPRLATEVTLVAGFITVIFRLLARLGSDITGLIATSAVATAVIGFALQDMLGNMVGGAVLELEGGIKPGEWIKSGTDYGCVRHVRLRHTEILTADGETVYIPNSLLTRTSVAKIPRLRRVYIPFYAPYSQSPEKLQREIENALNGSPLFGVSPEPRARCIAQELASSSVKYSAVVWLTEPGHESTAISGVLTRIYFALSRAGVAEIPQLLELHRGRKESTLSEALEALRNTPIFRQLEEIDLQELSTRMRRLSYAPGEYVMWQGEHGDSMFFITEGEVSVVLNSNGHTGQKVATLNPGDFVGEACLLTGEPRTASVIADTPLVCYMLDKRGLQDLMERSPEIAEDMSVVIAHRSTELSAVRERLDQETLRQKELENQVQLLTRIRRFFGISATAASQVN